MRHIPRLLSSLMLMAAALGAAAQDAGTFELTLVDMKGNRKVLGTLPDSVFAPRVSPDGKQVAFELADPVTTFGRETVRLYVADLKHIDQRRVLPLTTPGLQNWAPIWTPDGKRLVYLVSGSRPDTLYWRKADGSGDAELLMEARAAEGMYDGGNLLAFITLTGNRDYGIWLRDMNTRAVTKIVDYPASEQHSSRFSPDGRWIAYVSNETGRQEVWLEALPQDGKRYRLTQDGGRHPEWSPDGSRLYFDQGGQMYRVDIFTGAEVPKTSAPVALPIRGFQQGDLRRQYDLLPDGSGFVMLFRPAR
jgi:eukaryotic-like serine/threonine-protein kinase